MIEFKQFICINRTAYAIDLISIGIHECSLLTKLLNEGKITSLIKSVNLVYIDHTNWGWVNVSLLKLEVRLL